MIELKAGEGRSTIPPALIPLVQIVFIRASSHLFSLSASVTNLPTVVLG